MSRLAVEKAIEIHAHHPGLSFPIDMEWLSNAEGCDLVNWPFLLPIKEVKRSHWIGIAEGLNKRERRHLIAHALAHHILHCGNQLSFRDWQKTTVVKQEREAEECAAHILMPETELARVIDISVWEIAEYFGVPKELACQRISEFATEEEVYHWQLAREDNFTV